MGRYKLLEFFEDGKLELYDLEAGVGEQADLAAREPAVTARLHGAMKAWRDRLGAPVPTEKNPRYDPSGR